MQKDTIILLDPERRIPDYLTDSGHAEVLRRRVENYYHNQGFHSVKVWIDSEKKTEEGSKFYYIRSNLKFKVPKL
jgi:hypothetical protein